MTRREFLEATSALTVAGTSGASASPGRPRPASVGMPRRRLGRTGETVSALGLGGFHIGMPESEAESIRIIRAAIDGGITFLDNCWDYNDGRSETRMGKALRDGYRRRAFLMTKFDGRDAVTAARQIDESLRRLQTDHVDLLQLHEVIWDEDPQLAFAPGGAVEAMEAARRAGKARLLGFTGHKSPALHLAMLDAAGARGFRFDAVQLPLNVLDAHFDSFEQRVLPRLVAEEIGVLGMKPLGAGLVLRHTDVPAEDALRYALSLPTSVVITGMQSMRDLEQALKVGRDFRPLAEAQVAAILARTAAVARDGRAEQYKTAHPFDGTFQHKEWLGPRAPQAAPAPG